MHYYLQGVLAVSWISYIWDNYLTYRQYKVYKNTEKVPNELAEYIDHETFTKSKAYSIDKARFGFFSGVFGQIQNTIRLCFYLSAFFWNYSSNIMIHYGFTKNDSIEWEIFQSIMFTFITSVISTIIGIPFTIYFNFVIEERHGFNKQTWRFFVWDQIKLFALNMIITTPIVVVMIYIARYGGPYFFLYLWLFVALVTAILTLFSGELAGLFDKITALPPGDLRQRIEDLAKSIKFPLSQIFLVEGSKRSSHSNAYQAGIFNRKRIVLYDTLLKDHADQSDKDKAELSDIEKKKRSIKNMTHDEILAVICHELGHWHCNHLIKNMIFSQANLLIIFVIFSRLYKDQAFYEAFGFQEMPVIIGLMLVIMVLTPYLELEGFIAIAMGRRFEYEADHFAKKKGFTNELRSGLIKLNSDNLGFPVYDELYSKFNHSHPTLIQRMKALEKAD